MALHERMLDVVLAGQPVLTVDTSGLPAEVAAAVLAELPSGSDPTTRR